MKKEPRNKVLAMQGFPQTIISVRDAQGRNNALAAGYVTNVNMNPAMMMVGIGVDRFSHHMIKENPCFVINIPEENFRKEYLYFGTTTGANLDKFAASGIAWQNGDKVDAPILPGCPVNIECRVVDSAILLDHEVFVGVIEKVHVDEQYLDAKGNILWDKMELIGEWAATKK